ncbi:hypothetical protein E3N88_19306 [Mikania micrantha]|uniref:Protein kinase domain-containing protein n=1 Tax=Mikania micrantha TaxID=192012 RepID=A0A5N6NPG6_9ASTR|nr:hypothetical protein E3N88_19306 [Mikania micrantha]
MKCFHYFKDKTRSRVQRSEPSLKDETNLTDDVSSKHRVSKSSESTNPRKDRVTKSSGSASSSKDQVMKSSGSASSASPRGILELYEEKAGKLRVFTYAELRQATNDFTRLRKIGEGGFGCVYKGSIKPVDGNGDPIAVAVKKLNRDEESTVGSPSSKNFERVKDELEELTEESKSKSEEVSESSKRRLAQLAKLSEHVGGVDKKGFMIMHRAKVS